MSDARHGYRQALHRSLTPEPKHPRLVIGVRVAVGVWLLALTIVIYGFGPGGWWGALLVPAALLHFYLAYRLGRATRG